MKIRKLLLVLCLSIGIGIIANNTPAQASSWHKGTPTSIRGTYKHKTSDVNNPVEILKIKTNKINHFDSMLVISGKNTHYKYLGNRRYVISFKVEDGGGVGLMAGKTEKIYVHKLGKNIKLSFYSPKQKSALYLKH